MLKGVPQGSMLGPLGFNVSLWDLFLFVQNTNLVSCTNNNMYNGQFRIESNTAQKIKFSIWSHLLKKSLMENFIFCAV